MTILDYVYMILQIVVLVPLTMLIGYLIRNRSRWIYMKLNPDYGRNLNQQENTFISDQTRVLVNYQWQTSLWNEKSMSYYIAMIVIGISMLIIMLTPMFIIFGFQDVWSEMARPNSEPSEIWFEMLNLNGALIVSVLLGAMVCIALILLMGQGSAELRNQVVYQMHAQNNNSSSSEIVIQDNIEKMVRARQISIDHLIEPQEMTRNLFNRRNKIIYFVLILSGILTVIFAYLDSHSYLRLSENRIQYSRYFSTTDHDEEFSSVDKVDRTCLFFFNDGKIAAKLNLKVTMNNGDEFKILGSNNDRKQLQGAVLLRQNRNVEFSNLQFESDTQRMAGANYENCLQLLSTDRSERNIKRFKILLN